jgi:hypothetical protein
MFSFHAVRVGIITDLVESSKMVNARSGSLTEAADASTKGPFLQNVGCLNFF